jgi:putative transposase
MEYYRRHLPHIHPEQATFFITFRLHNSLPNWIIRKLQEDRQADNAMVLNGSLDRGEYHRRYFLQFDRFLDAQQDHNCWLNEPNIASIVADALSYRDGTKYDLMSYCIMPNHVHLLIQITDEHKRSEKILYTHLTSVMQSLKSYTAKECNKLLGRNDQFWQRESYDRMIRDQHELDRTIQYIIYNPVAAGFVKNWRDWKFTYCCYDL